MAAMPLANRNAMVLGVERPAGRRAAVALAEAGANVAVVTLTEETQAEFAANSTANEFWAIGRKCIVLTSDSGETTVAEAITDAAVEFGPISILVWHAPRPLPRAVLAGLRSDPAIVVLVGNDDSPDEARALAAWTADLAASGLRANAIVAAGAAVGAASLPLTEHNSSTPMDVAAAVVYLASDATAAIEGEILVAEQA
jgi:NAD(P)-dependent dehydrogenase (short-subunit alcohol dehydrogenase family)